MARGGWHFHSTLHVPDAPAWHLNRYYVPALADALRSAYGSLHGATANADGYFAAYVALIPFRNRTLCAQQRLHLEYALALAYTGERAYPQALDSLLRSLEIAEAMGDGAAQVELNYLAGSVLQVLSRFAPAYDVYDEALETLRELAQDGVPVAPEDELDLVLRKAGRAWELGWFPVCLRHLDEAYALRASSAPEAGPEAALLAWIDGQLSRVLGNAGRALNLSVAAAELLQHYGQTTNTGRIQTVVAECALDLVEMRGMVVSAGSEAVLLDPARHRPARYGNDRNGRSGPPNRRAAYAQAQAAAREGLRVAKETGDTIGVGLAQLALRRAQRVRDRGENSDRGIRAVERVMRIARRSGDTALWGRAEQAMGEELEAAGDLAGARSAYFRAQRILEEFHLDGMAFWPRQALLRTGGAGGW